MIDKSLDQQVNDILDTLYEAADVPHINRRYLGRQFTVLLGKMVDQTLIDYMESAYDPTGDIRDLQTDFKELQDEMNRVKQKLETMGYEWKHRN